MKILGIETSCDETAVAIVDDTRKILAHEILSQSDHEAYGGVIPEVAARAHLQHMDRLIREAMTKARLEWADLDGIAVTAGPGLIGGVMVGVVTAKAIAAVTGLPVLGINHLEGHALTARLSDDVAFPFLLLLVSGGHCQILIVRGVGDYQRLGTTIDDAAGEAFDKTAKLMGLGYPGGPAVEKMAAQCTDIPAARKKFPLPRPMRGEDHCHFSFSGLKTAVRRMVDQLPPGHIAPGDAADICFSFQEAVGDIVCDRLARALPQYLALHPKAPTLVVAGGVAANKYLRARLEALSRQNNVLFVAPPMALCTDNAAMIAWAGIERLRLGLTDVPDFPVRARWPLDPSALPVGARSEKR